MRKPSPALLVAVLALFVALGGVGVAATGGNFILGQSNSAANTTALAAPVAGGKALQLSNTNATSGSTALGLTVASGHAPLTVSSAVKVANLNADQLDGRDSAYFLPRTAKAADADKLDGLDSTALLHGPGNAYGTGAQIARATDGSTRTFTPAPAVVPGMANISIECPPERPGGGGSAVVRIHNLTENAMHVFLRNSVIQATDHVVLDPSSPMKGYGTGAFADITHLTIWGVTEAQPGLLTQATVLYRCLRNSLHLLHPGDQHEYLGVRPERCRPH